MFEKKKSNNISIVEGEREGNWKEKTNRISKIQVLVEQQTGRRHSAGDCLPFGIDGQCGEACRRAPSRSGLDFVTKFFDLNTKLD